MIPPRPFSFAVQAAPARHAAHWADLAREVENLGYRALLVPDHVGSGGPLTALAAAGAVSTSLRVGPLMLAVDLRRPVDLVQELMTLDALVGGRLEIGLGAGWMREDYARSGVRMADPATRIDRLRDFAALLRAAWDSPVLDHRGPHFQVSDAPLAPRPASPRATVVMGGGGRGMLALAAEHADVVNLSASMAAGDKTAVLGDTARAEAFDRRVRWIAEGAAHRVEPPELQCLAFHCRVTRDARDHVAREVAPGFGLDVDDVLDSPLALVGTPDELCRRLEAHRARYGISYWVVKSTAMHEFAPVVERLAGR